MERKINALVISAADSVAVVIEPLQAGDVAYCKVAGDEREIRATQDIPIYHKIALVDIPEGQQVFKYGKVIGSVTKPIKIGDHVHTHNVVSIREAIVR